MDPHSPHTSNNFDALRILLAASVILFHTAFLSNANELSWFAVNVSSSAGVQGFFFVSGFLVVMSYERSTTITAYFSKRIRRIAPAYIATVVGFSVLLCVVSTLSIPDYFTSGRLYKYLLYNLALSNFAEPTLPGVFTQNFRHAVNGSLWTIKIEVLFYVMVPAICWAARRLPKQPLLLGLALLSLAWNVGLHKLGVDLNSSFLERLSMQAPGQLSYFLGGTIAYYRAEAGLLQTRGWQAALGVIIYYFADGYVGDLLSPVAVYFFMSWAAFRMPLPGDWTKYGDISYGIYLLHWPVIQVMIAYGAFLAHPFLASLTCWCIVVMLAYASWHLVERRFLVRRPKTETGDACLATT